MMIEVIGWKKDSEDYRGKDQPIVYRIVMNGQARDVSKADLIRAIEMNLAELSDEEEEDGETQRTSESPAMAKNGN